MSEPLDLEFEVGRILVNNPTSYRIFRDVLLDLRSVGGLTKLSFLVDCFEKAYQENNLDRFSIWLSTDRDEHRFWMKLQTIDKTEFTSELITEKLKLLRERLRSYKISLLREKLSVPEGQPVDLQVLKEVFLTVAEELSPLLPSAQTLPSLVEETVRTLTTQRILAGDFASLISKDNPLVGKVPLVYKEIAVISGRTGRGKTSLALNIIYKFLIEGKRVLHISTEMPRESIMTRLCSIHTGKPTQSYLQKENLKEISEDLRLLQSYILSKEGKYAFLHAPAITYADIEVTTRLYSEAWDGLDLIVIDYIQQIQGESLFRDESRALQLRRIVQSLHHLTSEVGAVTLVLSQLNDQGDVKDSRAIEEEASLNLRVGLWTLRDYQYEFFGRRKKPQTSEQQTVEPEISQQVREFLKEIYQRHIDLEVKKNRYGESLSGWRYFLNWDGKTGRIENIIDYSALLNEIRDFKKTLWKSEGIEEMKEEPGKDTKVKEEFPSEEEILEEASVGLEDEETEDEFPF